jgi:hypothetical protein
MFFPDFRKALQNIPGVRTLVCTFNMFNNNELDENEVGSVNNDIELNNMNV